MQNIVYYFKVQREFHLRLLICGAACHSLSFRNRRDWYIVHIYFSNIKNWFLIITYFAGGNCPLDV